MQLVGPLCSLLLLTSFLLLVLQNMLIVHLLGLACVSQRSPKKETTTSQTITDMFNQEWSRAHSKEKWNILFRNPCPCGAEVVSRIRKGELQTSPDLAFCGG